MPFSAVTFSAAAALAIIIFASAGREIEFSSSETYFSGFLSLPASFPQIFRDFSRFFRVFCVFSRIFGFGASKRTLLAPRALMSISAVRLLAPYAI